MAYSPEQAERLLTTKGSVTVGSSAAAAVGVAPGGPGQVFGADATTTTGTGWKTPVSQGLRPVGALFETFPRILAGASTTALTTGRVTLTGLWLPAGVTVTAVTFVAGTVAYTAGTSTGNQWAALFDGSLNRVALSPDGGNTAWAASAPATFTFTSGYPVTVDGFYYLGLSVTLSGTGGVVPSMSCANPLGAVASLPPVLGGLSASTGLTTPGSCPATVGALTSAAPIYAYVAAH